jgi:hypothetical protein
MIPFFIISTPRSKAALLMRMLDATPGVRCAGESSGLLVHLRKLQAHEANHGEKAAVESGPMHRHHADAGKWSAAIAGMLPVWLDVGPETTHGGIRTSFLGKEGWNEASDWWSWLLETWPTAKIIFLGRDQGEIELSMMQTRTLWRPAYGTCAGHCGGRVFHHLRSMQDFHELNPGRSIVLDAEDLSNFDRLAGELGRIGIPLDGEAWEEQLSIVSGRGKELSPTMSDFPKDSPPVIEHPAFREGSSVQEIVETTARLLYVVPVGEKDEAWRETAVRFLSAGATIWLLVYDDSDPGFPEAARVIRAKGWKFGMAIDHLAPATVEEFDYIFLWDGDVLAGAEFDPKRFAGIMASHSLVAAQPAITGNPNHEITKPREGLGRETNFVEIMAPVFSREGWKAMHGMLERGNESGWGYDWAPIGKKGIIDAMTVEHTRPMRSGSPEAREECLAFLAKHGLTREIKTLRSLAADPDLEAWKEDPFGDKANAIPDDYAPKMPRAFTEHPQRHERAIVYPWLSTAAAWDELRYSLRSVEAHFADKECPIYILGDKAPSWFVPGGRVRFERMEGYEKSHRRGLFQAFTLGLQLAGEVCWMNDDIKFLRATSWDHLRTALTEGDLTHKATRLMKAPNRWKRGLGGAVADLRLAGHDTVLRFATHTPFLFQREKSLEILRNFHLPYKGGWVTIYHNYWRTDHRVCGGLKTERLPASRKARYLNYNDYTLTEELKEGIKRLFPVAGPWEKAVPKRIHQTWKTAEIPHDVYPEPWQASWRELHPDWAYELWTDEDLLALAEAHYPTFVPLMREALGVIKADVGRLLVLHRHGGLYADLDYIALRPMDELVSGGEVFVSVAADGYAHNALLAAVPGNEFIMAAARAALARWKTARHMSPEWISGPVLMTTLVPKHKVTRWDPDLVTPLDWRAGRRPIDPLDPGPEFPDAYAVTTWRHNW